ncbi:MAG: MFS transporter [Candidatus Helarchaeota archaeon]|nr:MFS transporter [Candidatus Helarchaeota archaeon]
MISNKSRLLIILFVSWFFTMCDRYVTQLLFPVFETLFLIPNEFVLIISTEAVWWAGYSTSAIIGGLLSDKFLRKKLISITLFFYFVNTFLIAFALNLLVFIFFRIMSGLFAGTFFPLAISLVSDAFPEKKEKSRAMGIYVSGAVFANAIAPLIIAYLIDSTNNILFANEWFHYSTVGNWGLIYQIFSIPLLIMSILVYFGFDEHVIIKDIDKSDQPPIRSIFTRNLNILLIFITLDLFELWTLQQWLPYLFQVFFLTGVSAAGGFSAIGGFIGAFGAVIFGIIGGEQSKKTGKKKGNRLTLIIAVFGDCVGLLIFISLPKGQASIPYAIIAIMLVIFAGTGEYAAIYTLITESVPPSVSGKTMGICIGIANFSTVGGLLIQGIVGSNSPTILMILWIPIIAALIQLPISYLYNPTD